ncbi:uncharacterized protein BX663DRAFT_513624 [Cokeromyces recurvatus]|uniref:uncharacterized protein n=1 Tax=Cokeromyces recurvatus TaxID=90255 RepID=UPI002220E971|nr:uncharacterized protein BX663DRAFT_523676 [Cokeromyces recurvatus]XP_051381651.1 uncharacterized protein BX663DRAFT_513624 [Cokeromyces recurvatus]KAI7898845.1 hypothetical protein BX663DRAFT_523676 [Cokeromyces recurvatus]KAI7901666.1 hypothetical protein BX663DRAFT_513624 [Cokeromyces recurvatus]
MSKRNLRSLEHLADEEQKLYINIRRNRIRKQNEKSKKFDYFEWVTKNNIYDCSDKSKHSHFDNLSQEIVFELDQLNKKQFNIENVVFSKLSKIMNTSLSWKKKLAAVEKFTAINNNERAQKEVYRFILNQHVHKANLFSDSSIKSYSEEDFKLKFWSHIFEEIFGYSDISLKWGDTVPSSLSKSKIISKMDLRVGALTSPLDYSLAEFAKKCTSHKYYLDKLKLILISKLHLNLLVQNLQCKETDLYVPFMQIMGFDCHLLHLVLVKPKQYMLVNVVTFSYPVTKKQINEGGIEQLINVLSYIKRSAIKMKEQINSAKIEKHVSKIDNLLNTSPIVESKKRGTKVIWPDKTILDDVCMWDDNTEDGCYDCSRIYN